MTVFFAAVLTIVGVAGAVALAVAVPVLLGAVAYEIIRNHGNAPDAQTDAMLSIAAKRGVARGFVVAGGVFWSATSLWGYSETGMADILLAAAWPLLGCLATLVVGWYYERITAALLALASIAIVAWGVIYSFEAAAWMLVVLALLGPMMTASVLFWLARREQEAFELTWARRPELALAYAARSTLL